MQNDTKRAIETLTSAIGANTTSISNILGRLEMIGDTRPSKAAPDLLDALIGLREWVRNPGEDDSAANDAVIDKADAAIAKATR